MNAVGAFITNMDGSQWILEHPLKMSVLIKPFIVSLFVLQSLILQIALNWLEQEKKDGVSAKEAYMAEHCPAPDMSGDQAALMVREAVMGQKEKTQSKNIQ